MKERLVTLIFFAMLAGVSAVRADEGAQRGLFVTVLQEPQVLASSQEIERLVDFAKKSRIGALYVQIYYANRAWFPSKLADAAPYEVCRKEVGEDPFGLLIRRAHAEGIEVHAWVNMLSLGSNKDAPILGRYGTGILTRNTAPKGALEEYKIDGQYFLEPGDPRVRAELEGIVGEIVRAYPALDGIQFDYIRYPDTHPSYGYTQANVERFRKATGREKAEEGDVVWQGWKRAQVTGLLEGLIETARLRRPGLRVSATGCMPYPRAYYEAFQDWPYWLDHGLVDFVTVMDYSPYPGEFTRWAESARKKVSDFSKVNIAIGAYKMVRMPGVFGREVAFCLAAGCRGFVVFHYGSLLERPALCRYLQAGE